MKRALACILGVWCLAAVGCGEEDGGDAGASNNASTNNADNPTNNANNTAVNNNTNNSGANNTNNANNAAVNNANNNANNSGVNNTNNANNAGVNNANNAGVNNTNNANNANNNTEPMGRVEGDDLPDCISGCGHEADETFLRLASGETGRLSGKLDGETHTYTYRGAQVNAKDMDLLAFKAPTRSFLVFELVAPEGSPLYPALNTLDLFQVLTFSSPGDGSPARTALLFPYIGDLPIHVLIDDGRNYRNFPDGPFVGGEDHRYELRWAVSDFDPEELGALSDDQPLTREGALLAERGDMNVYRFEAAGGEATVTATPAQGASPDLSLVVVPLTSAGGAAEYGEIVCADPGSPASADWSQETIEGDELLFVVFDCNGGGGEGFEYGLTVEAP